MSWMMVEASLPIQLDGEAEEQSPLCGAIHASCFGRVFLDLWGSLTAARAVAPNGLVRLCGISVRAAWRSISSFSAMSLVEHVFVAAAVGFGDLGAEFALAAFQAAVLEGVEGAFDLLGQRWRSLGCGGGVVFVLSARARCARSSSVDAASSGLGGAGALARASSRSAVAGRSYHSGCSASCVGGEMRAGSDLGQDQGAEQDALGFGGGLGAVRADAGGALGGGLFEFLAEQGGVDAQLLRGVGGELVALDAVGHAADVGQQEVEGLDLGVGGARRGRAGGRGR